MSTTPHATHVATSQPLPPSDSTHWPACPCLSPSSAVEFVPSPPAAPLSLAPALPQATASCAAVPTSGYQTVFAGATPASLTTTTLAAQSAIAVRLSVAAAGMLTAIRFYKPAAEAGTGHVGRIYASSGRVMATTVVFSDSSCRGPVWVTAPLTVPVATTAGALYTVVVDNVRTVVSTAAAFASPVTRGSLTAQRGGIGPAGTLPAINDTRNFWVDGEAR